MKKPPLTRQEFIEFGRVGGIKSSQTKFRSLVTGMIGSAGSVALHHKALNVSPDLKERYYEPN